MANWTPAYGNQIVHLKLTDLVEFQSQTGCTHVLLHTAVVIATFESHQNSTVAGVQSLA